ncbi:MAG: hypothetical protein ACHQXA_08680 [Gemmatimonadales bacterium]
MSAPDPTRTVPAGRFIEGGPLSLGRRFLPVVALVVGIAPSLTAQSFRLGPVGGDLMGQATLVGTTADPMPHDQRVTELRITQPVLSLGLHALDGHLQFRGTLDFEGWTIPEGELTPGAFGEGYVDRRHPHTYVHELMLTAHDLLSPLALPVHLSAAFGKGFVPFGTDDPMSRPVERFPVNHHLAQILEREVAIAGLAAGPAAVELSWFNGDEPEYPSEWPNGRRFGDSYALRGTLRPLAGVEAQLSYAEVKSPEHRAGAGPTQDKWSASVRFERQVAGNAAYALAEFARTTDAGGAFVYDSWLIESALWLGRGRPYLRLERTDRPEETRVTDYRTARPHLDNSILGITRWTVVTVGAEVRALTLFGRLGVRPFGEASLANITAVVGLFDPAAWYGGTTITSLSLGVRADWGMEGHRMGHYGTASTAMDMEGMHQ